MADVDRSREANSTLPSADTKSINTYRALLREHKVENEKLRHVLATTKEQVAVNDKWQKDATDYRQKYFGTKLENARLRDKLHSSTDEVEKLRRSTISTMAENGGDFAAELESLKNEMDNRVREAEHASQEESEVAHRLSQRCTELTESLEDMQKSDTRMAHMQVENEYRAEIDELKNSLAHTQYLEAVSELKANADVQALRQSCSLSETTCGESMVKIQVLEQDKAQLLEALQVAKARMNELFLQSEEVHACIELHGDPEALRAQLLISESLLEQSESRLSEVEVGWQEKVGTLGYEMEVHCQAKDEELSQQIEEAKRTREQRLIDQRQNADTRHKLEISEAAFTEQQELLVHLKGKFHKAEATIQEMDHMRQALLEKDETLRLSLADTSKGDKLHQMERLLKEKEDKIREQERAVSNTIENERKANILQEENERVTDQLEQSSTVVASLLHERQDTYMRLKDTLTLLHGSSTRVEKTDYVDTLDQLDSSIRELLVFAEDYAILARENARLREKVQTVEKKHFNLVEDQNEAMRQVNHVIHKLQAGARFKQKSLAPASLLNQIATLEEVCLASKIHLDVSPLRCRSISVPPLRNSPQFGALSRSDSSACWRSMPGSLERDTFRTPRRRSRQAISRSRSFGQPTSPVQTSVTLNTKSQFFLPAQVNVSGPQDSTCQRQCILSPEPISRLPPHTLSEKPAIARLATSPKLTTPHVFRIGVRKSCVRRSLLGSLEAPVTRYTIGGGGPLEATARNAPWSIGGGGLPSRALNRTTSNPILPTPFMA